MFAAPRLVRSPMSQQAASSAELCFGPSGGDLGGRVPSLAADDADMHISSSSESFASVSELHNSFSSECSDAGMALSVGSPCASDVEMALSIGSQRSQGCSSGQSLVLSGDGSDDDPSAGKWQPGSNCGPWVVGKVAPLLAQGQVLVTNAYVNMRRLPVGVCQTLLSHLGMSGVCKNYADWCVAAIMGISKNMVRTLWRKMHDQEWEPSLANHDPELGKPAAPHISADDKRRALVVRVREAVYTCAAGGTSTDYIGAIHRMQMAGLKLGSKYDHHSFLTLVEHLAVVCCRELTGRSLMELVPSLGIPSDLSLVWDGVSIGGTMWSRGETLCVIGVGCCDTAGHIHHLLVSSPSENLQKAGESQVELVLRSLRDHPARLSAAMLRRRLSVVGGDGAVCAGGPEARHASTGAAEKLWSRVNDGNPLNIPCTEWDLFHRVDAAFSNAMRAHAGVSEIMDVGKALGALFAVGDGRALYRSAQAAIGAASRRVVPDQGGTRKVVAIASSIQYVTRNLEAIHAGIHARLGLARGGASAQSQHSLIELSRRVSAMNFVMFSLAVDDILQGHVSPLALAAQVSDAGALGVWRRASSTPAGLAHAATLLSSIEDWWFVTSLVGQMVSLRDLGRLWLVIRLSALGRAFPRLVSATHECLWRQAFAKCQLGVDLLAADVATNVRVLSPRCQCASMRTRRRPGGRRAAILFNRRTRDEMRQEPLRILVPEWVAHSCYGPKFGVDDVRAGRGPRDVQPRFLRWTSVATPAGLAGEHRFAQAPAPCRCVAPSALPSRLQALRQASQSCKSFIAALKENLEAYLGTRGASDTMVALLQDASLALAWGDLAMRPPTLDQHRAFLRLVARLRPALSNTLWPDPPAFPHVQRAWPAERGTGGWFQQYTLLAKRLRQAARPVDLSHRWGWWTARAWVVRPVVRTVMDASLGQLSQWRRAWHAAARSYVCQLVGEFLGLQGVSARSREVFCVSLGSLAIVGKAARLPGARGKKAQYAFRGGVGGLASLSAPARLRGKVVCVVGAKLELDENALEASLAREPSFTAASRDGDHCYHAVRLCHRVRMMRAMESCCERWGSFVHQLWDGNVCWHPSRIAGRLLMREAGLANNLPATEAVVQEVALYLEERRGMSAFLKRGGPRREATPAPLPPGATLMAIRRALRESTYTKDDARADAEPMSLLSQPMAAAAVQRALDRGAHGRMEALPSFFVDQRTEARASASSESAARLQSWLDSEEAAAWRSRRTSIFGTGNGA